MKRDNRGFSLLELVATVAIVAVLITIVAPSFKNMIYSGRQTTAVNELIRAIHVARSEAAKRAVTLNLSAVDALDGGTLTDTNEWGKGWKLWEDADNDNTLDSGEEIMAFVNFPEEVTMESNSDTVLIQFSPTGRITMLDNSSNNVSTTTEYILVCDSRTGEKGKKIEFSTVGQPKTTTTTCP